MIFRFRRVPQSTIFREKNNSRNLQQLTELPSRSACWTTLPNSLLTVASQGGIYLICMYYLRSGLFVLNIAVRAEAHSEHHYACHADHVCHS